MAINQATAPRDLGRSLALSQGDLVYDVTAGSLATVQGLDALSQALRLAIQTQLESDLLNVTFGFDQLSIGSFTHDLVTSKEYIKMQLVRCISSDRRVKDVREIFFQDDLRYFEVHGVTDPAEQQKLVRDTRASRSYTVFIVVEVVTGQQLTLQASGSIG